MEEERSEEGRGEEERKRVKKMEEERRSRGG